RDFHVTGVQTCALPIYIAREKEQLASAGGEDGGDPLFRMSEGELKKALDKMIAELKSDELAMAPRDSKTPSDVHLRVRGEPAQQIGRACGGKGGRARGG